MQCCWYKNLYQPVQLYCTLSKLFYLRKMAMRVYCRCYLCSSVYGILCVLVIIEFFRFLVAICVCLCLKVYIICKKLRLYWKIFLCCFVSPFFTTLIWIFGRQELCKWLLFTSVKWYLDNTRPGEQDCVREYSGQTHPSILHSERWMSLLCCFIYDSYTWLFGVWDGGLKEDICW